MADRTEPTAALYLDKEPGYFNYPRLDLLAMLPPNAGLRLLEIGAGNGATLRQAKALGIASYTVGVDIVEPSPADAADAADAGLPPVDRFLCGDVDTVAAELDGGTFDVVLCADVLEHLIDPWRTVTLLTRLLKPGGIFLSSIPNLRNHRALRSIVLGGDFRYAEAGLLDRTHLRFFCRKNIRELFEQAGLQVEAMEANMGAYGLRHRALNALTAGRLKDFFIFQYRTLARKP